MKGYWEFPVDTSLSGTAGIRDLPYTVMQFLHQTGIKKVPDIFSENSGMTKMVKIPG